MPYKIVISIINYRTAELTKNCVQSVLDDMGDIHAKIVIVDNASGDGSAEEVDHWLREHPDADRVQLVCSRANTGFSGGHNLGMAAEPDAEFYLILNSDALLTPGFLRTMLDETESQPKVGLFGPSISGEDGELQTSCFRFHSPLSELNRAAAKGLVTKLVKNHVVSLGTDPDTSQIEWMSFACIMLRGEMVHEIGPMDEGYFLYYEDTEYCLRAGRAGWGFAYLPQARAVHFCGGSGPVKSLAETHKRLPPYYYASRTRFIYQAHGYAGLIAANLLWYVGRSAAWIGRGLGTSFNPLSKHEARDIWTNVTRPLGPRFAPGERK